MEKLGKLVFCDRCGKETFLEVIGKGEADGGYTKWNKFEPFESGWKVYADLGQMLCPECSREYKNLMKEFKNKTVNFSSIEEKINEY